MRLVALPKTLLARNIALLIVLVLLSQLCSLVVLLHYVQRPRVERTAQVFASYVKILDTLFNAAPDSERSALITRLNGQLQPPADVASFAPPPGGLYFYTAYQRAIFLDTLRHNLPADMPVRWQSEGGQHLWIQMHAHGEHYWLALPVPEDARGAGLDAAILLSLGLAALAAFTGYLIQRHLNRPLQNLARAARRVSAGEMPEPLPGDGPTEIAEVSGAFNQMTHTLQQAEATRALMLAGISHDIRTPLTKLRLAMAMAITDDGDDSFVIAAEAYLDQIETILQQFMDYAGSGERELPQTGDINALIERLAGDFAGLGHEFALSLGAVPVFAFRPIAMMRLLMNLMQNAVVYGQTGFAVRTWVQNRSVYVAVGDRGKGLAPDELEALKQPFQRGRNARSQPGGTGLGLAIVERIARLHSGALQFHAREGGGLEVWVVVPLAA
ncbi:ATP-binding protein [Paraburkholderia sp. DHOC27]|uniref:ATP-binding protein n=1 Tax=Paraburkholderia sp. DHOC27 TaxID=2303330 RepID=UPI000E3CCFEE|nr:ATP-binding protein [Paraburkholderia sp. DHOC27]RFU48413.1 HAMP domain-containing protein [Paraburkholderia sp. DHOC27]